MKIALGGFHIESCTFSPLVTREEDFKILRGSSLRESYPFLDDYPEVETVPLLYARAIPGGPVDPEFYRRAKQEFLSGLAENGPFDGIFLHMHGAVSVLGMEDAEGDFIEAIRQVVGKGCFIAASYDLHGNVSERVMDNLDFLSAYRTAPHIDWYETLSRVFAVLVKCLKEGLRPYKARIAVPILLPGERTSTGWEPAASLYQRIPGVICADEVMDASILIGYVWADEPRSSACVLAYGLDPAKVNAAAIGLAQRLWDVRGQFLFGVAAAGVDDCIQAAMRSGDQPVVISDSGDNPTAGGAGDTTFVLERLLAAGAQNVVFASIADEAAVRACEAAGQGSVVDLSLGGKLDPIHSKALAVHGAVQALYVLPWTLNARGGEPVMNRIAVVAVQGIQVIVTERRTPFHHIHDFTDLGIDPYRARIVVVKIGYLEPELQQLAARAFLALSPGAVNQDIEHIPYTRICRPMYPFDPQFEWSPSV